MILTYHKVAPESPSIWWVTADVFWRQMAQLARYQVVDLDDYDPSDPQQVVITFDGVYECVYRYALPILRKFGYPFELFIVGNSVGCNNEFDQAVEPPARFADSDQLEILVRNGGRLQWHSQSHQDMTLLDFEGVRRELDVPDHLKVLDQKGFNWLAYPHGKCSPAVVQEAEARFRGAVVCDDGDADSRYQIPRVTVTNKTTFSISSVSLIIANYNYGRFAAEAIESALTQSIKPAEILFIDDCSQDQSMEIAERYRDQITVVRNEKNLGITDNFNKAVSLTTGEYICFLGADNRFRSDYVERCQRLLDEHPKVAVVYTDLLLFGPRAEVLAVNVKADPLKYAPGQFVWRCPDFDDSSKRRLKTSNFIHGSSMYRRNVFHEVGGYRKTGGPEDHDLFLRMIEQGWEALRCPTPLLEYRQHSNDQANVQVNHGLELAHLKKQMRLLVDDNLRLKAELNGIRASFSWEILEASRRVKKKIIPEGSRRRLVYLWLVHAARLVLYEGRRALIKKATAKFLKIMQGSKGAVVKHREGVALNHRTIVAQPPPSIDVVIVTYNSASCIERCLLSLHEADYPYGCLNIFVVDNDSTDGTIEVLESGRLSAFHLEIVKNERNLGFGAANNIGFRRGHAKYLLLLNPDAEVEKSMLSTLVQYACSTGHHKFGAWEPRQRPYEHPKIYDPVTLETEWVSGACCLILREAFEQAGGFDPNIFLYGEDVDLSWRLRAGGYKLQAVPEALVSHYSYASPGEIKPNQFGNSVMSNGILRHKYGRWGDIVLWYLMFIKLIIIPPLLPGARILLLEKVKKAGIGQVMAALKQRAGLRAKLVNAPAHFDGWNYEIRRDGVFYETKPRRNSPLVSVIIRTMDRPFYLREALQTVRNQTYRNVEVVVVDDGAVKSKHVLEEFGEMRIIYIPGEGKLGRCKAGNLGLARAKGSYINFLDEDDLWFADHVEVLVGELEAHGDYGAAYSEGFQVETELVSDRPFQYSEWEWSIVHRQAFDRDLIVEKNYIPINCLMFARNLYDQYGGFDENLSFLEDWDIWIRFSRKADFKFIPKTTCLYRVPRNQTKSAARQQALDAAYPVIKRKSAVGFS